MKHIHIPIDDDKHTELSSIKECHNKTWEEMLEKAGETLKG